MLCVIFGQGSSVWKYEKTRIWVDQRLFDLFDHPKYASLERLNFQACGRR